MTRELRLAVGYTCNLACPYCYAVYRSASDRAVNPEVLTADDYGELVRATTGLNKVSITGGEPFVDALWPKTRTIIQACDERAVPVRISTNGLFLTETVCRVLSDYTHGTQLVVQVSLDGATAPTHDQSRRAPGAFEQIVRGIQTARRYGIPIQVRYTLTRHNWQETGQCVKLCHGLDVSSLVIKPLLEFRDGTAAVDPQVELHALHRQLDDWRQHYPGVQVRLADWNVQRPTTCACGQTSVHVTPNGDVYACGYQAGVVPQPQWRLGNIRQPNWMQVVEQSAELTAFGDIYAVSQCPGAWIGEKEA